MRKRISIVIFFLLGLAQWGIAQQSEGCLTKYQLIKMQNSSIGDITQFLNSESWSYSSSQINQTFNYRGISLNYNLAAWEKAFYRNGGKISIFYLMGKSNIVDYECSESCFKELFNGFRSGSGNSSVQDGILLTSFKEGPITLDFVEYPTSYSGNRFTIQIYNSFFLQREIDKKAELIKHIQQLTALGDNLFASARFKEAKDNYLEALGLQDNDTLRNKINDCNDGIANVLILKGDSLSKVGDFEGSLNFYRQALLISNNQNEVNKKIEQSKKNILEKKINVLQTKADSFYSLKNLIKAEENYRLILELQQDNLHAKSRIQNIYEIKELLEERKKTIYPYHYLNPDDFKKFNASLISELNNTIDDSDRGFLKYNINVTFDTLGKNLTTPVFFKSSVSKYENFVDKLIAANTLSPIVKYNYYLASTDKIEIDANWNSFIYKFKSRFNSNKELGIHSDTVISNRALSSISNYIEQQKFRYGNFKFQIKTKQVNNSEFDDIKFIDYNTDAGPACVFYSILMPGWGTQKVTYGEKGLGRTILFLLSSAVSVGSKIYSDQQFKNYTNATNPSVINQYYQNANSAHQISLVSGGFAACIYINDIIGVISRGARNRRESQYIKKELQAHSISVANEKIPF